MGEKSRFTSYLRDVMPSGSTYYEEGRRHLVVKDTPMPSDMRLLQQPTYDRLVDAAKDLCKDPGYKVTLKIRCEREQGAVTVDVEPDDDPVLECIELKLALKEIMLAAASALRDYEDD